MWSNPLDSSQTLVSYVCLKSNMSKDAKQSKEKVWITFKDSDALADFRQEIDDTRDRWFE